MVKWGGGGGGGEEKSWVGGEAVLEQNTPWFCKLFHDSPYSWIILLLFLLMKCHLYKVNIQTAKILLSLP